jgi:alpha-L-fucosidase
VLEYAGSLDVAPQVLTQLANGKVELLVGEAKMHGDTFKLQSSGLNENIGCWTTMKDWANWEFKVNKPGKFDVVLNLACDPNNTGSQYDVIVAGEKKTVKKGPLSRKRVVLAQPEQKVSGKVESTGGWDKFIDVKVGDLTISQSGMHTLSIKPTSMPHGAVMNLKAIVLTPAK